jgi:hypothetical protein
MSGSIKNIKHQDLLDNVVTRCLTKAGLAIATTPALFKTVTALITYQIGAALYSKAAQDNIPMPTVALGTAYLQPVNTTVFYPLTLDAAGNYKVRQGDYAGQILDAATPSGGYAASKAGVRGVGGTPDIPSTECIVGYISVATNGATTFSPGVTSLAAGGLTVAYVDAGSSPG